MKTTVWYLLVICLIKVKEMVNYIFAQETWTICIVFGMYSVTQTLLYNEEETICTQRWSGSWSLPMWLSLRSPPAGNVCWRLKSGWKSTCYILPPPWGENSVLKVKLNYRYILPPPYGERVWSWYWSMRGPQSWETSPPKKDRIKNKPKKILKSTSSGVLPW